MFLIIFSLLFKNSYDLACFGILNTHEKTCSYHGNCTSEDVCECDETYSGDECENFQCPYEFNCTDFDQTQRWIHGSNTSDESGIYGNIDEFNFNNTPGARRFPVGVVKNDSLYLFGGYGYDEIGQMGYLNDFWEYSLIQENWRWFNGSKTIDGLSIHGIMHEFHFNNTPGGRRHAVSWIKDDSFYLFGGWGIGETLSPKTYLNDLWEYSFIIKNWKWLNGSKTAGDIPGNYGTRDIYHFNNVPGARHIKLHWNKDDSLYLFGGYGIDKNSDQGRLNDLWEYSLIEKNWRWLNGSKIVDQFGSYGTKNVFYFNNIPGGRYGASGWAKDDSFYLFSGYGYDVNGDIGDLNDLWEYSLIRKKWRWLTGTNIENQPGIYGNKYQFHFNNTPGARTYSITWRIENSFFLFGGDGYDSLGDHGKLNDFWEYSLITKNWRWLNGSNIEDQPGSYGIKNEFNVNNFPGGRQMAKSWSRNEFLYLFGGMGEDSVGSFGHLNDLWEIKINFCLIFQCFGTEMTDIQNVCSGGHGECIGENTCCCEDEWSGLDCSDKICPVIQSTLNFECFNISLLNISVCSGHGICLTENNCSCIGLWIGDECSIKILNLNKWMVSSIILICGILILTIIIFLMYDYNK